MVVVKRARNMRFCYIIRHAIMMLLCATTLAMRRHCLAAAAFSPVQSQPLFLKRISTFSLQASNTNKATLYSINDETCPPLEEDVLRKTVVKHIETLDRFLEKKPIARHTQEAFDGVVEYIHHQQQHHDTNIILDSGCGTGRSSLLLGEMYPHHVVIGIDRSMVRLNRNVKWRNGMSHDNVDDESDVDINDKDAPPPAVQQASPNVFLVRAELVDFWRLLLLSKQQQFNITHHYLLYPNPYPKKARFKHRWYAHASFPILLQMGATYITIRSNWKGYLDEFAKSVVLASQHYNSHEKEENWALPYLESALQGPKERTDKQVAWTNFEQKYDDIGESTFELKLEYKKE